MYVRLTPAPAPECTHVRVLVSSRITTCSRPSCRAFWPTQTPGRRRRRGPCSNGPTLPSRAGCRSCRRSRRHAASGGGGKNAAAGGGGARAAAGGDAADAPRPGCWGCCGSDGAARGGRLLTCHGCGVARCCGRACQEGDWAQHKPVCCAVRAGPPPDTPACDFDMRGRERGRERVREEKKSERVRRGGRLPLSVRYTALRL